MSRTQSQRRESSMAVRRAVDAVFKRGGEDRFTGQVWLWQPKLPGPDGSRVAIVHFTPGSRTRWHRHPGGQLLYAVTGRGRVRTRGERGDVLDPGDVVYVGSKSWHFHGAGPDTPMVHVAVTGSGSSKWGKAVGNEEYAEGF
jgi:quercetin dioxygenase-like cupin family protein